MIGNATATWPVADTTGPLQYEGFKALQRTTRSRLRAIYTPARILDDVVASLMAYKLPLNFISTDHLPPTRTSTFTYEIGGLGSEELLSQHIDGLFVRTAVAGLWPRFFRCAAYKCPRFGVLRKQGAPPHYCRDSCRGTVYRSRKREVRADQVDRALARFRELQGQGVPSTFDRVCREFGFSVKGREAWVLLRRLEQADIPRVRSVGTTASSGSARRRRRSRKTKIP